MITELENYINGIGGVSAAARKLDVNKSTIHRWLNNSVEVPGLMRAVLKLSNTLIERDQQLQQLTRIKNELKMTVKQLNVELEELKK